MAQAGYLYLFLIFPILNISQLFIDPINKPPYYYSFVVGGSYEVTAKLESIPKNKNHISANDNGDNPLIFEAGTDKKLTPNEVQGRGATYDQLTYSDPSLVGYWPFEEGTGTTTKDLSGNGNNGTLCNGSTCGVQGPTWTTGKVGGALIFDGVDDYVDTSLIFNSPSYFTVAAWVKVPPQSTQKNVAGTSFRHPQLLVLNSGYSRIQFGSSAGFPGINSTIQVVDNNWHYLVGVLNVNTLKIYIDGNINNSGNPGSTPYDNTLYHFQIGAFGPPSAGLQQTLQGLIDEVRIYNRALSDAEIQALYNATK
jgi:hypothetical protein